MAHPVPTFDEILGDSPAIEEVRRFARRAARVRVPVLLQGETGTGKSLLARVMHGAGERREGRFVAVNCAGIPDTLFESELFGHERGAFTGATRRRAGLFEAADGGTLFLDEVGELSARQQAKLLTVLDEGRVRPVGADRSDRVDIRVVSATARDPLLGDDGALRRDLYHRLAVLRCVLPPLRDRPGDIPSLARRSLDDLAARHGLRRPELTGDGLEVLAEHDWPGNVRELLHVLEAALVLGDGCALDQDLLRRVIDAPGTPPSDGAAPGDGREGARYSFFGTPEEEKERIRAALVRSRGNKSAAARSLGMARNTLASKIRKYGLEP